MRSVEARGGPLTLLIALLAPWILTPATASALTLEEAIRRALDRNELARAADETARAAEARIGRARSFLLPDLTLSGDVARRSGGGTDGLEGRASLNQTLFDAQAWPLLAAARRQGEAARADAVLSKRLLAYETAARFLSVLTREQVVRAADERLTLARRSLDEVEVRFGAQLVSSNDVTRATLEVATAEREWVGARGDARTARVGLGYLLDAVIEDSLAVPQDLLVLAARPLDVQDTFSEDALLRRPDVRAERARVAALRASAREPLLRFVPDLEFFGSAGAARERNVDAFDDDWSLGVGVVWALFDGGERFAERSERTHLANAAELELANLERGVEVEVETARVALESEQASLTRAETAVDAARRNAAEAQELYRQGLVRAFEVVDAGVQLFEAEVARAGARFTLMLAYLDLREALGLDPFDLEDRP